jgi:hypothetical protein
MVLPSDVEHANARPPPKRDDDPSLARRKCLYPIDAM